MDGYLVASGGGKIIRPPTSVRSTAKQLLTSLCAYGLPRNTLTYSTCLFCVHSVGRSVGRGFLSPISFVTEPKCVARSAVDDFILTTQPTLIQGDHPSELSRHNILGQEVTSRVVVTHTCIRIRLY